MCNTSSPKGGFSFEAGAYLASKQHPCSRYVGGGDATCNYEYMQDYQRAKAYLAELLSSEVFGYFALKLTSFPISFNILSNHQNSSGFNT